VPRLALRGRRPQRGGAGPATARLVPPVGRAGRWPVGGGFGGRSRPRLPPDAL